MLAVKIAFTLLLLIVLIFIILFIASKSKKYSHHIKSGFDDDFDII